MSHINPDTGIDNGTPAVPAIVRTVTYFVLLAVSALTVAAIGLAPIWFDDAIGSKIVATCAVIGTVMGVIAGGLGVAYRPTR